MFAAGSVVGCPEWCFGTVAILPGISGDWVTAQPPVQLFAVRWLAEGPAAGREWLCYQPGHTTMADLMCRVG